MATDANPFHDHSLPRREPTPPKEGLGSSACSAVPDEVISFLLGEGPLEGVWFGEKHPTERGNFWWRKHLRQNAIEMRADQKP